MEIEHAKPLSLETNSTSAEVKSSAGISHKVLTLEPLLRKEAWRSLSKHLAQRCLVTWRTDPAWKRGDSFALGFMQIFLTWHTSVTGARPFHLEYYPDLFIHKVSILESRILLRTDYTHEILQGFIAITCFVPSFRLSTVSFPSVTKVLGTRHIHANLVRS